ncbi:MAG: translation initiation factor IF-3 [Chitinispirillaceae bacterium]|nr:translation initiation factor IF-3 [Chitinispirillaceae bacterium]
MNRFRSPQKRENEARINNEIRVSRVRVINAKGEPLGILSIADALSQAINANLDLVEVAPNADPPVCRIMDYGKFKYEKSKKAKEAKKKQHVMHLKEIKLHPQTEDHDFNFKMDHARKFLIKGDRVKITVVFRGREITHIDFGRQMLGKATTVVSALSSVEIPPKMEGRNLIAIFVPDKLKVKEFQRKEALERKKTEQRATITESSGAAPAP